MSEETKTPTDPTPPTDPKTSTAAATPATITLDQINEAIAAALKPITEQLAGLGKTASSAAAGEGAGKSAKKDTDAPAALTPEAVAKIVADQLAAHTTTQAAQTARTAYANDKLKDLPQTYRDLLPNTGDPAQLAQAEQAIRARYRAEIGDKAAAGTNLGGGGGGAAPQGKVDLSKLSPQKKIEMGLQQTAGK